jgi:acyl-CoA-binding protein
MLSIMSTQHRFLNHVGWDGKLDGKDNSLRAARNADGQCIEYKESTYSHFGRVGDYVEEGPNQRLSPGDDLERSLALKIYGTSR